MSSMPTAAAAAASTNSKRSAADAVAPRGGGPRALSGSGSDVDASLSVKRPRVSLGVSAETAMPVVGPPSIPPSAAALQQLVRALDRRESDLRDDVHALVCMRRHLAKCAADLPADPAGVLGTFAVTVPMGTITVAGDAFRDCTGLSQVTLPPTVTAIEAGVGGLSLKGAFSGC